MSPEKHNQLIWIAQAPTGAITLLDVEDTFDHDHYPVYIKSGDDAAKIRQQHSTNMQRIHATHPITAETIAAAKEQLKFKNQ